MFLRHENTVYKTEFDKFPIFFYFPLFPLFLLFIFLNLPPSDILTNYRQIGESRIQGSYKK